MEVQSKKGKHNYYCDDESLLNKEQNSWNVENRPHVVNTAEIRITHNYITIIIIVIILPSKFAFNF